MNLKNENLTYLIKSIQLNYKSWIILFICLYIIHPSFLNFCFSIYTFLIMLIVSYFAHLCAHMPNAFPGNLVHLYHHDNSNWFSHFIQIVLEFVALNSVIFTKHFHAYYFGEMFFYKYIMQFMDEWIILFGYLFYTTVHNINYSYFHINSVHESHHKLKIENLGPDCCDIFFGTKYNIGNELENTDHYIPNIVLGTGLIIFMKYVWNNSKNKEAYIVIFGVVFCICVILLFETTCVLYIQKQANATPDPYNVPTKSCESV